MGKKISILFLLVTGITFGQKKETEIEKSNFQPTLLKASATIAPTRFLNINSSAAMLNGYLEYVLDERISVRGDVFYFLPNATYLKLNPLNVPESYSALHAGFGYHIGKKNWKHSLHFEPGVSYTKIAKDNLKMEYRWTVNPSFLVKVGTCLYVSRFFHFFAELNYCDSYVRTTPVNSISMKQIGISAGLGFHLVTKQKSESVIFD